MAKVQAPEQGDVAVFTNYLNLLVEEHTLVGASREKAGAFTRQEVAQLLAVRYLYREGVIVGDDPALTVGEFAAIDSRKRRVANRRFETWFNEKYPGLAERVKRGE